MKREDQKSKKIVFVNQATGYLTIDIINAFVDEFDKVAVIYGDIRVQDIPLDNRVLTSKVIEKSRKSNFHRLIRWLIASVQILFLLLTKYKKYEIFYFSVPPFAYLSSLFLRRRFSLLMWDVYPDALKMAGISDRNLIYKLWTSFNIKLFRKAYRVYTIGDALVQQMNRYAGQRNIVSIPLWSGIVGFTPVKKIDNPFINEQKLSDKFIVQYSGNLGPGHNIEVLLEAAKQTISDKNIVYIIIGRGYKHQAVKEYITENKLSNCRVLPYQPDDMIKFSLSAADINVVLVEDRIAQVSIPSKIYNLFTVGSAIVSITPEESEICKMINTYSNGRNFDGSNPKELARFIKEIKDSPELIGQYQKNSLLASQNFTNQNAQKYLNTYLS